MSGGSLAQADIAYASRQDWCQVVYLRKQTRLVSGGSPTQVDKIGIRGSPKQADKTGTRRLA